MYKAHWIWKLLLLLMSSLALPSNAETIHIGLRAHQGVEKGIIQWQPTAEYLSRAIPEHEFIMYPYESISELNSAAGKGIFDFVITNPSSYIEMEVKYGASRILTLQNLRQGKPYSQFGSVIFTRHDRDDINTIKDIKGKHFMSVSKSAFGGWRMAWKEMLEQGVDPYRDFESIRYGRGLQQNVVYAVLAGEVDAGSVRTDMLEGMAKEGEINLSDIKILNAKDIPEFPFHLSTRLYPEWPLAKFRHTSTQLSQRVAIALMSMPSIDVAAIAGDYYGWTVPLDYQPVHELLKDLKVAPYEDYGEVSFYQTLLTYWYVYLFLILMLSIAGYTALKFNTINRRLNQATQQLTSSKNELEMRVQERTRELEEALIIAENANKAKTEFLSRMSHELRTPMNAILGFAELMAVNNKDNLSAENADNLNEIRQAGQHLLALINEVLQIARIEAGKQEFEYSNIDLESLIESCLRIVQPLAITRKIQIEKDIIPVALVSDETRVKQVIINLLANAIKYNYSQGLVTVECRKLNKTFALIRISNTGPGIQAADITKIFEPFERLRDNTETDGTGIGLTVCKQIVEAMGGSISVTSEENGITVFSIQLRLKPEKTH
ncbi:MAG: sensor histidine kinase [Gammaproteobacteria bacterium]|nr:sensor histidine kinase [Gammaproteobacteria bacterium]